MPVQPTYPGLYINEIPLNSHAIVPAPTSVTVIIGYTHLFKTKKFKVPVRLFSFSDYQREFGGMFRSGLVQSHVPNAVNQFYLNGGSELYVVGLDPTGGNPQRLPKVTIKRIPDAAAPNKSITFIAKELTDQVKMSLTISNLRDEGTTFDLTVTYGNAAESYRGLSLTKADESPIKRVNTRSELVEVEAGSDGLPAKLVEKESVDFDFSTLSGVPATTFSAQDFVEVMKDDGALDKVDPFNIILTPGVTDQTVSSQLVAFAEKNRAFAIIDAPVNATLETIEDIKSNQLPMSENGAVYFPYLKSKDAQTNLDMELPPSGSVAGLFARTDQARGVWKAPAGLQAFVRNTTGPVERGLMTDNQHGKLNPKAVNCLRQFPGQGTVIFGARTLVGYDGSPFPQSKYVPVRRMTLFIEQTLLANLRWVVFEPNAEPLWIAIRTSIEAFMLSLFNQGALKGTKPSDAFRVICDSTTTTPTDIDNGIVNIQVAVAPLKPAEFVIIHIAQIAGQTAAA